jgi:hypothetical protein
MRKPQPLRTDPFSLPPPKHRAAQPQPRRRQPKHRQNQPPRTTLSLFHCRPLITRHSALGTRHLLNLPKPSPRDKSTTLPPLPFKNPKSTILNRQSSNLFISNPLRLPREAPLSAFRSSDSWSKIFGLLKKHPRRHPSPRRLTKSDHFPLRTSHFSRYHRRLSRLS